jgi:subtilisin family serine protease
MVMLMTMFGGTAVFAADPQISGDRPVPAGLDRLRVSDAEAAAADVTRPSRLAASLLSATGIRQVVVRLSEESVGEVAATGAGAAAQQGALRDVTAQQDSFLNTAGGTVLARTEIAINAVVLEVNAAKLAELAANPAVISISPVVDYTLGLTDSVPYIGATAVHADPGFDGSGVTVAVLDSGIDYTHVAFGDYATVETYDEAYGVDTGDQANKDQPDWALIAAHTNIVGGFDFVGEAWPDSPELRPDADPIDCGGKDINPDLGDPDALCEGGHGTHVSDIIGGEFGVAPGVDIHAVKVCSAVSTSCSGVALLLGMDYALDPNADGDTSDHVDIINMSLGSPYGQAFDDDLSLAVETAADVGVLTVASAGNSADKPYVTGTPAAAPSALSVAQTAMPESTLTLLEVITPLDLAGDYPAVFQPWSAELTVLIQEPLFFDDSTEGRRLGCRLDDDDPDQPNPAGTNPFIGTELDGFVVLVDRGACTISEKVANIALAGGSAALVGMVDGTAPSVFGLGDCPGDACDDIPGFSIARGISLGLQGAVDPEVRLDPDAGLDLTGTMAGSSSRGPTMLTNIIKPEIGAPGASVSAEVGTADGTTPFGGTSGAAPMVTGSAALLLEAFSDRSPAEIKALLMNYAETEIFNGAPDEPINSPLAAIQRIGAGEVRVDRSVNGGDLAAWVSDAPTSALSFGFVDAFEATTVLTQEVTVANYGVTPQTLDISSTFRFADDETNGAVDVSAPANVLVPAGDTATFDVTLTIDGDALRDWTANSGGNGASAATFNVLEYDGYLELDNDATEPFHLPWHVLPRLSGDTTAADDTVEITGETLGVPSGEVALNNAGVGPTAIEGYSLIGESSQLPTGAEGANLPTIDIRYAGVQTIPVPAGFCSGAASFLLLLSVNTWERQTHANAPAAFEWDIDIDADGEADWAVFNFELAGNLSDGRNVVIAQSIADPDDSTIFFFTDHATNSANTVLTICAEQIGLTGADFGTPLTADLLAVDIYFMGRVTDQILGMEFSPLGERFFPVMGDNFGFGEVPAGGSAELDVLDFGVEGTNPSETGLLLFTDGTLFNGTALHKTGSPQANEALVLRVSSDLPFDDILGHIFADDIVWAFENGITAGCSVDPPLFCPDSNVTREQMAIFLDRALELPDETDPHPFTDIGDRSATAQQAIQNLWGAGITAGCTATKFCPTANVTREQMAIFLDRGVPLPDETDPHPFTDIGSRSAVAQEAIHNMWGAGITSGCTATKYCPLGLVTRGQMAAFLHRAVGD